jgi:hypothetical protein
MALAPWWRGRQGLASSVGGGGVSGTRTKMEGGDAGQQGGDKGLPERRVNVEVPIRTGAMMFTGGDADAVVTGNREGLLQLQEVDGVPLDGSAEEGAASHGRRRWRK